MTLSMAIEIGFRLIHKFQGNKKNFSIKKNLIAIPDSESRTVHD